MPKTRPFDPADHLDNPKVIAAYLNEAFQTGDSAEILAAVQNVARAGNLAALARETGLSRTSLYWGNKKTSPEFTTVLRVLAARGVRLVPHVPTKRAAKKAAAR
jgi:probable addiction module antidote protein